MKTETKEETFRTAAREAENYAIGGMINNFEDLKIGCESLSIEDFYFEENKIIFKTIQHLVKQDKDVNFFIIDNSLVALEQDKNGKDIREHLNYLSLLGHGVDIKSYIRTLKDFSAKRKLLDSQKEIFKDIQLGKSLSDVLEKHKKKIESIEQGLIREDRFQIKCIAELGENWLYDAPPPKKMILEYRDKNKNIHGFIPKGNVCMLVGMGGIGKSHWVSQLTASIVTETLFLDEFTPTMHCKNGNVFLGLAENDIEDIRRILHKSTKYVRDKPEGHLTAAQIKFALENKIFPFSFHGQQCQFIKDGEPSAYFYELKRNLIKNAPKGGWILLVLDPISRFLGAEAEMDNAAATAFIALMEQLTLDLPGNPTILFCHHMNKGAISGNAESQAASRGASAITDGVRLQINLRKPTDKESANLSEEDKSLELTIMTMSKSNFTRILEDIFLKKGDEGYLSKHSKANSFPKINSNGEEIIADKTTLLN